MTRKGLTFPEHVVTNGHVGTARIRSQIGASARELADVAPVPLARPLQAMTEPKRSKYGNQKCEIDGQKFDSRREASRWCVLSAQQDAGEISGLIRQVRFEIAPAVVIDGKKRAARHYVADFVYQRAGETVIEDVKGCLTEMYKFKKHLMAVNGLTITEIK